MNIAARSPLLQSWFDSLYATNRARPVVAQQTTQSTEPGASLGERSATWAARFVERGREFVRWFAELDERDTTQDPLVLARRVERAMPNLAAELRVIAMRQRDATE